MNERSGRHQAAGWPEGVGMVYFGMSPWHGMWKSRHQLLSRFSRQMPVLYVEPCVYLRSLRKGETRVSRIFTDIGKSVERCEPNLTVFHSPAYLPVSGSPFLGRLSQRAWVRGVRRAMIAAGITRPIVWISRPERRFVIGQLGEILSIYHAVDEYAGYTGLDNEGRQRLAAAETELLDSVDLVIVASPELRDAKQGAGRELMVLENGVEPEEYAKARNSGSEPKDLAGIPRPRLGYSGLIGKRLDLELVRDVAQKHPECSVVLMGKVDKRECEEILAILESMPNVHLLGEKPGAEVASYVVGFDIGLLPYQINLETQHISPIKMYEYWAAGKPVVSTAIPAAMRYQSAVHVAESPDQFHSTIDRLIATRGREDAERLIRLAKENSWQSRVDAVTSKLRSRIGVV